ncbi:MAG: CoA-binding protein, partial [Candidatus Eremiobacteraeota bacterium]|nr:CoA-binding protein [Candidatus Eremiobacteraeota bacterium]
LAANRQFADVDELAAYADDHGPPDIVDVFRRPSEVLEVVREPIAVDAKCIWFQYGVINEEAIAAADSAGLAVVVDRCIKVETARFNGGLATSGLNSGLITSRRRG